ncbi:protein translocase subunit SecF [Scytonema sp. NUACC26]|uniref:protein translocase subunit SecF n=1 Tax=Scytonema sp. NUACC26 TaxID=3140176 RepID=UPI0034DC344D
MKLNVIKWRALWWTISGIIILVGLIAMVISWQQLGTPLRPSLDFTGGTRLQFERDCTQPNACISPIDTASVRNVLISQGLQANSSIQILGSDQQAVSISTVPLSREQRIQLQTALSETIGVFDPQKTQVDSVGPVLGRQLFNSGLLALLVSFVGITVYLSFRFQFDYAFFAVIALFHDILVTVGIFALLGLVQGIEVDSLFIVALLTIVGFSVNDTVVIYDRVRENIKMNPSRSFDGVVDDAVNQTLTRSINTSFTTLLPLIAIFWFGGETLQNFALALMVGFTAGVYSSIFIASTLLALWRNRNGTSPLLLSGDSNAGGGSSKQ